jgi:hypothetical protein
VKLIFVLYSHKSSPVFLSKAYTQPSKPPPITRSFVVVSAAEIPTSHAGFESSEHLSIGVNFQLSFPDNPSRE